MPGKLTTLTATIANGASLSSEVDLSGFVLRAIQMPADWTAANLTLQSKPRSSDTLQNVYDKGGTEFTITAADDRYLVPVGADAEVLQALAFIKIRSGTAGSAVNQGAARTLLLVVERRTP